MTRLPSRVALPEEKREKMVKHLNTALAISIDLSLQVKQAHWNIKGPQFFARHELFDKLAVHLRETSDKLAERAATLGGYAEGTVKLCAERSELPEYDLRARDGRQHIMALVDRYARYTAFLRDTMEATEVDPVSQDLVIETLRTAELDQWFLESHINV